MLIKWGLSKRRRIIVLKVRVRKGQISQGLKSTKIKFTKDQKQLLLRENKKDSSTPMPTPFVRNTSNSKNDQMSATASTKKSLQSMTSLKYMTTAEKQRNSMIEPSQKNSNSMIKSAPSKI